MDLQSRPIARPSEWRGPPVDDDTSVGERQDIIDPDAAVPLESLPNSGPNRTKDNDALGELLRLRSQPSEKEQPSKSAE